jgi:D-xylose transport system permease protein
MTSSAPSVAADATDEAVPEGIWARLSREFRAGNLGSLPVAVALVLIVIIFSQTAPNFFTAVNFNNLITQLAGTCLLAYGVVFVLLLGEIDLSISYVSGVAGVIVAELQLPGRGVPGLICIILAVFAGALIGAFQGSIVALIGVPSFVVTIAGFEIWQGVVLKSLPQGVIVIQDNTINNLDNYFFGDAAGWIIAAIVSFIYVASVGSGAFSQIRHGVAIRNKPMLAAKLLVVPAAAFLIVLICNNDRGLPFALLLIVAVLLILTVGGNAEAARRAGINVARIRILVFAISGSTAALGGCVLAARLNSVDLNAGGGTLLIDAISAAVIGGTSLFGGRGEVRNGLFGALVIATIANGLNTIGYTTGIIFIVTGAILLMAVTLDTVLRRIQARSGR